MSSYPLLPSKALLAAALALCLVGTAAAEAEQDDATELYEHLFPEAPRAPQMDAAGAPVEAASPAPRFSGFMQDNRRNSWSQEQINAMRDAFKRAEPQPIAPAESSSGDAGSSLFGVPPSSLEGSPYAELVAKYARKRNLIPSWYTSSLLLSRSMTLMLLAPRGLRV